MCDPKFISQNPKCISKCDLTSKQGYCKKSSLRLGYQLAPNLTQLMSLSTKGILNRHMHTERKPSDESTERSCEASTNQEMPNPENLQGTRRTGRFSVIALEKKKQPSHISILRLLTLRTRGKYIFMVFISKFEQPHSMNI